MAVPERYHLFITGPIRPRLIWIFENHHQLPFLSHKWGRLRSSEMVADNRASGEAKHKNGNAAMQWVETARA
jgi:hypothetical protein